MKRFYIIAAIITVLYAGRNAWISINHPPRDIDSPIAEETMPAPDIQPDNSQFEARNNIPSDKKEKPARVQPERRNYPLDVEDEIIICIAYVENFYYQAYFCGARWTIGYGSTVYPDGSRVQSGETISMLDAQKCARVHLQKRVFPYIDKYVTRKLSRAEIIGTSLFIYNVGAGNFANSAFLQAINSGENAVECVRRMTEFTHSAGRYAPGLLKREWVQGAIYCGYISPYDLLDLTPAGFYNYSVNEYFGMSRSWDGYYNPKYSDTAIKNFLRKNRGTSLRVIDIV